MFWQNPYKNVEVDIEFLAHEKGLLTISRTISNEGLEDQVDDAGRIWVKKGSFIDKDGKVTVPTIADTEVTFESDPIGILFSPVNVTYGPAHGAVMIAGWVKGDYMDWGENEWKPEFGEAIHKILPEINFKDKAGNYIQGPVDATTVKVPDTVYKTVATKGPAVTKVPKSTKANQ